MSPGTLSPEGLEQLQQARATTERSRWLYQAFLLELQAAEQRGREEAQAELQAKRISMENLCKMATSIIDERREIVEAAQALVAHQRRPEPIYIGDRRTEETFLALESALVKARLAKPCLNEPAALVITAKVDDTPELHEMIRRAAREERETQAARFARPADEGERELEPKALPACPALGPCGHACSADPDCPRGIHACLDSCPQWRTPPHPEATHDLAGRPLEPDRCVWCSRPREGFHDFSSTPPGLCEGRSSSYWTSYRKEVIDRRARLALPKAPPPPRCDRPGHTLLTCADCAEERLDRRA